LEITQGADQVELIHAPEVGDWTYYGTYAQWDLAADEYPEEDIILQANNVSSDVNDVQIIVKHVYGGTAAGEDGEIIELTRNLTVAGITIESTEANPDAGEVFEMDIQVSPGNLTFGHVVFGINTTDPSKVRVSEDEDLYMPIGGTWPLASTATPIHLYSRIDAAQDVEFTVALKDDDLTETFCQTAIQFGPKLGMSLDNNATCIAVNEGYGKSALNISVHPSLTNGVVQLIVERGGDNLVIYDEDMTVLSLAPHGLIMWSVSADEVPDKLYIWAHDHSETLLDQEFVLCYKETPYVDPLYTKSLSFTAVDVEFQAQTTNYPQVNEFVPITLRLVPDVQDGFLGLWTDCPTEFPYEEIQLWDGPDETANQYQEPDWVYWELDLGETPPDPIYARLVEAGDYHINILWEAPDYSYLEKSMPFATVQLHLEADQPYVKVGEFVRLDLDFMPTSHGTVSIEIDQNSNHIGICTDDDEDTELGLSVNPETGASYVSWPVQDVPEELYVIGKVQSASWQDVELKLSWNSEFTDDPVYSEPVKMTVVSDSIELTSNKESMVSGEEAIITINLDAIMSTFGGVVVLQISGYNPDSVKLWLDENHTVPLQLTLTEGIYQTSWNLDEGEQPPNQIFLEITESMPTTQSLKLNLLCGPDISNIVITKQLEIRLQIWLECNPPLAPGVMSEVTVRGIPESFEQGLLILAFSLSNDKIHLWEDSGKQTAIVSQTSWPIINHSDTHTFYVEVDDDDSLESGYVTVDVFYDDAP